MVAGPQQSEAYSEALVGIKIIPTSSPPENLGAIAKSDFAAMNMDPLLGLVENEFSIDTFDTLPASETQVAATKRAPKRRKEDRSRSSSAGMGISQRGPNWNEEDSILLVKAYKYSEEKKKCRATPELHQLYESKDLLQNRMYEHFLSLVPEERRSKKSVVMR